MSESVILCEGYYDRAFWAGWLSHLGCVDLSRQADGSGRKRVRDPWGTEVTGGQYGYHSRSGRFLRLVPCDGKSNILPAAESRLKDRGDKPVVRLVLCADADVIHGDPAASPTLSNQSVERLVSAFAPWQTDDHGDFVLHGGAAIVSVVRWTANDAPLAGLPNLQTLERLACAALVATFPARAPAVQHWLDSRPDPPQPDPKEYAWSYMAGWYAEFGCEAFYRAVWQEDAVVRQLKLRLVACGAWRVAEALAE